MKLGLLYFEQAAAFDGRGLCSLAQSATAVPSELAMSFSASHSVNNRDASSKGR